MLCVDAEGGIEWTFSIVMLRHHRFGYYALCMPWMLLLLLSLLRDQCFSQDLLSALLDQTCHVYAFALRIKQLTALVVDVVPVALIGR